jgi:tRNA A-37 threonylcarbamoyl transferase component Bud32
MGRALGRYELLRAIGRGGMADVFLARRRAGGIEKWLVVKRMRPERAGDARFLELFVREARLSMSLVHQNIVPVFDFGRIDDQVFLAMERVEGKDLGSSLARAAGHRLPPLVAAFVAAECCQALDYAHRRRGPDGTALGVIHRDVTPRNVLLSWSGEVKLTDFGIAALAGDATAKLLGTPAYMAPEQARGEPVDPSTDVYAVGLVLREALVGSRPRAGADRDALLAAARTGELAPWPAEVALPAALVAIADRATAPVPADRYADARTMLAELDAYIVAERAEKRDEAPARQLADWLEATWADEAGDSADGIDVAAAHLVSFLDDGALDVVGTGTERSMAATAAEPDESDDDDDEIVVPAAAKPATTAPAATIGAAASLDASATPPRPSRVRRIAIPAAILVVAAGAWVVAAQRRSDEAPAPQPIAATGAPDAAVVVVATGALDAAVVASSDAPHAKHPILVTKRPQPDAAEATLTRRVMVNAVPWAYFTVDSDPAQHQTMETIELPPGKHHLHFSNPQLHSERDATIEVQDRDLRYVQPME